MRVSVPPLQALKSESALYILYNFDKTHSGEGCDHQIMGQRRRGTQNTTCLIEPLHMLLCVVFSTGELIWRT